MDRGQWAGDGHTEEEKRRKRKEGMKEGAVRTGGRCLYLAFLPLIGVPPGEVI